MSTNAESPLSRKLPEKFSDLERFADKWCLQKETDRWDTRMGSEFPELQEFYDAGMARLDEALEYIDQYPLQDMPDDALNLMYLLYSLITISFTVECWGQVKIPDTGAADLLTAVAPVP
jgi:hypothetical protein